MMHWIIALGFLCLASVVMVDYVTFSSPFGRAEFTAECHASKGLVIQKNWQHNLECVHHER